MNCRYIVHIPSSVMLKKLSLDGIDSDVVLDAELTAACTPIECRIKMIKTKLIKMNVKTNESSL